jgi:hypothetical protein
MNGSDTNTKGTTMNATTSKLSKAQHDALAALAVEPEIAIYGFAVKPSGVSRATMRALLGKGMVSIARTYEGVAHERISGHFGRIAHTRRVTYVDIRYSLTDAGRAAISG